MAYGIIQILPKNRTREIYRKSGWWVAAGLWGVAAWGLITAYISDAWVELFASLILNGLIWKFVEPLGWNIVATALSVLGLALWWGIYILRHGAMNKIYAFPVLWGLSFLALRHVSDKGDVKLAIAACIGILAIGLATTLPGKTSPEIR